MPKLYDLSDDSPLGEISDQDLALLSAQLGVEPGAGRCTALDNDAFLRLTEAGASSVLLDAVKTALDRRGNAGIRWDVR